MITDIGRGQTRPQILIVDYGTGRIHDLVTEFPLVQQSFVCWWNRRSGMGKSFFPKVSHLRKKHLRHKNNH